MNTSALVDLAGTGATWVLYLLIALSAIQLAVIVERAVAFARTRAPRRLASRVREAIAAGSAKGVALVVATDRSLEARVLAAGAASADRGATSVREVMASAMLDERLVLERGLAFLGTLGNNAPFIGLFGTVLGVIHATQDLSSAAAGHAGAHVMSGISEALISTAVGLVVALPAVAAYNYFQRTLKTRAIVAESLGGELLAHLSATSPAQSQSFRKVA